MAIVTAPSQPVVRNLPAPRYATWHAALRDAVRDPRALCRLVGVPEELAAELATEETATTDRALDFPILVPRAYISRMRPGDPDDPLLRQVLATPAETARAPEESRDPVGDSAATLRPGLLHKYTGRVMLVTTGACAVHCRYCFRRYYPYAEAPHGSLAWQDALEEIRSDKSLREAILSGGDPLTLIDEQLEGLAGELGRISHLRRLRIHTRLPIVIPQRVTDSLIRWLTGTPLTPIVVIHANHGAELDAEVGAALRRLTDAGVLLFNQAVLLRGVNDSIETLVALCERLIELRVAPYYLHQLDRVEGAGHFGVPIAAGRRLMEALRTRLPGYAVPRYVQEIAGQPYKVDLA